ncbi:TPA: hypothetical protein ACOFK3_001250, partial [Klebsiella michiganensis]
GALPDALLRFSSRLALRLAVLQDHNRLRSGSPGKALAPRPGEIAAYSRTTPLAAASSRHASSG